MRIHGIDKRQATQKIKKLFEVIGHTSTVGNYPAIALSADERRYIVKRDGQLQVADLDGDSPDFNAEPFKNYRYLSDLSEADLESFMTRIAEDVQDYKGTLKDISAAQRAALQDLFPFLPDLDNGEDLEPEETNRPFLPSMDDE